MSHNVIIQGPYLETCSNLRHSNLRQKAVCPDLFATLPNVFHHINFTILLNITDVIFEVDVQYLRSKPIEK
jgi:hypothetical protein